MSNWEDNIRKVVPYVPGEQPKETKPNENSSINKSEFFKGVKFALDELAKGKTAEEILAAL